MLAARGWLGGILRGAGARYHGAQTRRGKTRRERTPFPSARRIDPAPRLELSPGRFSWILESAAERLHGQHKGRTPVGRLGGTASRRRGPRQSGLGESLGARDGV